MKTQDKLDMIEDVVVEGFENSGTVEDICGMVFAEKFDGIGFGEIMPLVKNLGESKGFIINQAKARAMALEEIKSGIEQEFASWADVEAYGTQITKDFNIDSKSWALNKIKAEAKKAEISLPEKLETTKWQTAAIEYYQGLPEGADATLEGLTEALVEHISNPKGYARLVFPVISALI